MVHAHTWCGQRTVNPPEERFEKAVSALGRELAERCAVLETLCDIESDGCGDIFIRQGPILAFPEDKYSKEEQGLSGEVITYKPDRGTEITSVKPLHSAVHVLAEKPEFILLEICGQRFRIDYSC